MPFTFNPEYGTVQQQLERTSSELSELNTKMFSLQEKITKESQVLAADVSKIENDTTISYYKQEKETTDAKLKRELTALENKLAAYRAKIDQEIEALEQKRKAFEQRIEGETEALHSKHKQRMDYLEKGIQAKVATLTEPNTLPFKRMKVELADVIRKVEEKKEVHAALVGMLDGELLKKSRERALQELEEQRAKEAAEAQKARELLEEQDRQRVAEDLAKAKRRTEEAKAAAATKPTPPVKISENPTPPPPSEAPSKPAPKLPPKQLIVRPKMVAPPSEPEQVASFQGSDIPLLTSTKKPKFQGKQVPSRGGSRPAPSGYHSGTYTTVLPPKLMLTPAYPVEQKEDIELIAEADAADAAQELWFQNYEPRFSSYEECEAVYDDIDSSHPDGEAVDKEMSWWIWKRKAETAS